MKQKLIIYTIIGLMIFSFIFFGVYDVISMKSSAVATINGYDISSQMFDEAVSLKRDVVLAQKNDDGTRKMLMSKAFGAYVLNEMINTKIISMNLRQIQAPVTQDLIAIYVANASSFSNGEDFDNNGFQKYLKQMHTNESRFIAGQIPDVEKHIFSQYMSLAKMPNSKITEEILSSKKQTRIFDVLEIPFNISDAAVSESAILSHYESIKHNFIEPRKHVFKISNLDDYIEDHRQLFEATEDDIVKFYNQKNEEAQSFFVAEFDNLTLANKVLKIIKTEGVSLQNVVKNLSLDEKEHLLFSGNKSSSDLDSNEGKAFFGITDVSGVLKKNNSFAIAQLGSKKQKIQQNYKDLSNKRICSNIRLYADHIESDFQSGETFENIVFRYGIQSSNDLTLMENSKIITDVKTKKIVNIDADIVKEVLSGSDASYAKVIKSTSGKCSYVIYKKEYTSQERVKTLDEIRGTVINSLQIERGKVVARQKASHIIDQTKNLKISLKDFANHGYIYKSDVSLSRFDAQKLPENDVFSLKIGESIQVDTPRGIAIYSLKKNNKYPTHTASDKEKREIEEGYISGFLKIYFTSKQKEYKVKIYNKQDE